MDCRSLDFEVVTSGRAPAPRTGVAHDCDDLRWIAVGLIEWVLL